MRAADLTTALVLMLVGGVVLYDALRLGIGWGTDGPRSGFFPFWLALIMVACCGAIAVRALGRDRTQSFATTSQLGSVGRVLAPAVGLVVAMQWLGLYVASALYIAVYMRWIGGHRWVTVTALALGIPLVTFLVFEKWFLVPMPKGPLEAWLGH
jgi:hypothetical protein